jgi:hypothetical protein
MVWMLLAKDKENLLWFVICFIGGFYGLVIAVYWALKGLGIG